MPDRASDGGMGNDLRREAEQGRWIRSFRGQDGRVTLEVINGGILNLHGHLDTEARRWLNAVIPPLREEWDRHVEDSLRRLLGRGSDGP